MRIRIHSSGEVENIPALEMELEQGLRLRLSRHEAAIQMISVRLGRRPGPSGDSRVTFKILLREGNTLERQEEGKAWTDLFERGVGHLARSLSRQAALNRADTPLEAMG